VRKLFTVIVIHLSFNLFSQLPTGTLSTSSSSVCTGKIIEYTLTFSPGTNSVLWKLPYGSSIVSNQSNTLVSISFTHAGIKTLSVVLSNTSGSIQINSTHTVINSARASFLAKPEHSAVPSIINLTNYSSSFTLSTWVLDNDFSSPISGTQSAVSFSTPGSHSITLISYGQAGCHDTNTYVIRLFDKSSIKLPNIFTPNNDGVNDVFRPIMEGIKSIHVVIFNRWGVLMKEWNQVNGYWDGYTSADVPCPEGTYFVVCEAEGVDGVKYSLKGSLQLAR
jgi:gliding motility-associated-like protein